MTEAMPGQVTDVKLVCRGLAVPEQTRVFDHEALLVGFLIPATTAQEILALAGPGADVEAAELVDQGFWWDVRVEALKTPFEDFGDLQEGPAFPVNLHRCLLAVVGKRAIAKPFTDGLHQHPAFG